MVQNNKKLIRISNFFSSHFDESVFDAGSVIVCEDDIRLAENDRSSFCI